MAQRFQFRKAIKQVYEDDDANQIDVQFEVGQKRPPPTTDAENNLQTEDSPEDARAQRILEMQKKR